MVATGYSQNNTYEGNIVMGSYQAIKLKESDGSRLINNTFFSPGEIQWVNSSRNVVIGNVGLETADEISVTEACFDETDEDPLAAYLCYV